MKVTIENSPSQILINEFNDIIEILYDKGIDIDEKIDYIINKYRSKYFIYKGGSHIAIHEKYSDGTACDERLIIITNE